MFQLVCQRDVEGTKQKMLSNVDGRDNEALVIIYIFNGTFYSNGTENSLHKQHSPVWNFPNCYKLFKYTYSSYTIFSLNKHKLHYFNNTPHFFFKADYFLGENIPPHLQHA